MPNQVLKSYVCHHINMTKHVKTNCKDKVQGLLVAIMIKIRLI